ncbi:MAG: hypothetical protein ACYDAY_11615 [Candidatus Dormibacteria bacterium]
MGQILPFRKHRATAEAPSYRVQVFGETPDGTPDCGRYHESSHASLTAAQCAVHAAAMTGLAVRLILPTRILIEDGIETFAGARS